RPVGAERLDLVEPRIGGVDGGDRDYLVERRGADYAPRGVQWLEGAGAEAEELQPPRLAREAVDDDVCERVVRAQVRHRDRLDRILRTLLGKDAIGDEVPVLVEQKEVVVVGRPAE